MNRKKFVFVSALGLLCTSLIAYGMDPPSTTASAPTALDLSTQSSAVAPTCTATKPQAPTETDQQDWPRKIRRPQATGVSTPASKKVTSTLLGGERSTPLNDDCEDAEAVTGPYPVVVCGSNVDATTDCPGVLDRNAVWYEIDLPYAVNKLVVDYCATEFSLSTYSITTVLYPDCSDCTSLTYGQYNWQDCGNGTSNPRISWLDLPGPRTVLLPVSLSPADDFCIEINVSEIVRPENDDCENAELVTAPYPVTVCGTNEGATADCPGTFNQKAVWYEIELPYATNNLETSFCASDFSLSAYQVGTIFLNDCSDCSAAVEGLYVWQDCGNGTSNATVRWDELPGPGTVMLPLFLNPAHDFCVDIVVTEVVPPDNDLCENAELVTGPYPTTICGTTQGATLDCPGVLDWNAVWYEVELPYAVNTIETDYCPSEVDMQSESVGIVYTTDCTCGEVVIGGYTWNDCGSYRANPTVWWRDVPGPGSIFIPVWIDRPHEYCIEFYVRDGICELPCPTEAVPENEACGENTNGGCLMSGTPAFEPLTCGETICGTGWALDNSRDTDWFELEVSEPSLLTFTVEAEFIVGVEAGLVEVVTPGVVGCDQITGVVTPYSEAVDCETLTVAYNAMPGTYWWLVAPHGWDQVPCGDANRYLATMTCEPWEVRGACCDDETGICTDDVLYQDCPEPMRFGGLGSLCDEMAPPCGGCPESMIEIQINTDRYPSETTWQITDYGTGEVICTGGPYTESFTTYFEYCCVETNGCYDFTIYDQAGDGQSWGNGGYAVRFDGAEICSTLENSWSGYESTCGNLGGSCTIGRCCYAPWPNCLDTSLVDCIGTYGGVWTEGMNCTDNPCQNPDAADFEVVAPYTSPQRSNCDALNRCHPTSHYYDTPEHVYAITIPHDGVWSVNTCLDTSSTTWLALGTSMCGEDLGNASFTCGPAAEIIRYLPAGEYYADVEGYFDCVPYVFDVHEIPVCDVECPADSTPESEACGENTNGGCWGWPQLFEPISEGQTICGTIYADNGTDSDWFEFVATADATMTWTVRANFAATTGLAEQRVPGQPGCANITGVFNPSAQTSDCDEVSIDFPVTAGGTYYLYLSHQSSYGSPCGTTNDYVATLTGTPQFCGDLDADDDCDTDDYAIFRSAFGTCLGDANYVAAADFDGDECITLVDYQAWNDCFRTANPGGKSPVAPSVETFGRKESAPVNDSRRTEDTSSPVLRPAVPAEGKPTTRAKTLTRF